MPADGSNGVIQGVQQTDDTPRRQKLDTRKPDFSQPLVWDKPATALEEFHYLVKNPPLHSVVIHIGPAMAEHLLKLSNTKNRPKTKNHAEKISRDVMSDSYELTGDTIKFSKKGVLLDGQHRFDGCTKSKQPILTHVVFGLDDSVFDVLDQGKKRTPGDILALCGVQDYTLVAGSVVWVLKLESGFSVDGGAISKIVTPRQIKEYALGKMKAVVDYVKDARLINIAYKHPPTMIAGLLFLIGKRDAGVARDFAHEWVHGAKIGRNKNFDVLNQRIQAIAHQNGGTVNRNVRAALLIQTFNYWNAGVVASPRALTWKKGWTFPTLEFDKSKFKEGKAVQDRENTSLSAVKYRVHYVLTKTQDKKGEVQLSLSELAETANVSRSSVGYILEELKKSKHISQIRPMANNRPAVYRVNVPAAEIAQVET